MYTYIISSLIFCALYFVVATRRLHGATVTATFPATIVATVSAAAALISFCNAACCSHENHEYLRSIMSSSVQQVQQRVAV